MNYTIFLAEFKRDKQKALTLSEIVQEMALTRIDDSANAEERFTVEENLLINNIQHNIELWREEIVDGVNSQGSSPMLPMRQGSNSNIILSPP